jgi:uncharacterized lipoprotein YddW (UPF0748 family)
MIDASTKLTLLSLVTAAMLSAECLADKPALGKSAPILNLSVEVDLGADRGQNFGSLFEVYDQAGKVVAGAGFLGAYNTQPRSDRGRLHFFIKQANPKFEVHTLPRVNQQTGIYLSQFDDKLLARTRNGRDANFYAWDAKTKQWQVDKNTTAYEVSVAGKPLHVATQQVIYAGKSILDLKDRGEFISESYYAAGHLILHLYSQPQQTETNRLIAVPWSAYSTDRSIDLVRAKVLPLRSEREFVYAFGQLGDKVLAATNTGGVYVFGGGQWAALVEPDLGVSYQVYAMINYYDRLLLGQYPTGELFEYDGQELKHLVDWPPVMPGVRKRAREAQTLAIYGGDLYVGVWPWGEVWRYDHNLADWWFAQRMFSEPSPSADITHPYDNETKAVNRVANVWGQRVTGLVPFGDSLFVSTSSKTGFEYDPKYEFLGDGKWKEYGKIHQLRLPGQLSAAVDWKEGPTTFEFTVADNTMSIRQDGRVLGSVRINGETSLAAKPSRIAWGRGVYGNLQGTIVTKQANLARRFLGAYVHLSAVIDSSLPVKNRERQIDEMLDSFRDSGLRVVMPYVTSTSGSAFYPSEIVGHKVYGGWDPLQYIIDGAKDRSLDVYPVFCVLACGHDKPAGILLEHPEWGLRDAEGEAVGSLSPAHPESRQWVVSVIDEVVSKYEPDGILLDYLRFPNRDVGFDAATETRLSNLRRNQASLPEKSGLLQSDKEESLTQLAREISETVRRDRPELQIALYSWGPHVAKQHRVAQNWPAWSRAGYIDMVNISGYCYPENYGEKYLEVFQERIGDAVKLNRETHGRADVTFCLGVATSHGKIRSASWVNDYLQHAADQDVKGTAIFTFSKLQPYLPEVNRHRYLSRFAAQIAK